MLYAAHNKINECNWNVMKFVNGISGYISMNDKTNLPTFNDICSSLAICLYLLFLFIQINC
jgi:hypothetical protein